MPEADDFAVRNVPHIAIDAFREPAQYRYPSRPQDREPRREDYHAHAEALLAQLAAALADVPAPQNDPRIQIAGQERGAIVEIETLAPATERSKATRIPTGLDFPNQDVVVLRSQRKDDRTEQAVLFVPDNARAFLRDRIERYGEETRRARPGSSR